MPRPSRANEIDQALLAAMEEHPRDLVRVVAQQVGVSRPPVVKRVAALLEAGFLERKGTTRPRYRPGPRRRRDRRYPLARLTEDRVWNEDVSPLLAGVDREVRDICHYGLTEMVNNAIDHSGGRHLDLRVEVDPQRITLVVQDDGMGIFRKITRHLDLSDERLALLELAKGKLTTDPVHHTGEGVFFTSRVFDRFRIRSGGLLFSHDDTGEDDVLHDLDAERSGTTVTMAIARDAQRSLRDVFTRFSSGPEEYAFDRTVVPVRLARLGQENLVSRSQAKRLLQRVERFRRVVLDFGGVDMIGQGFSDEIFRVFVRAHPEVALSARHAAPEVARMIVRAGGQLQPDLVDSPPPQPAPDLD